MNFEPGMEVTWMRAVRGGTYYERVPARIIRMTKRMAIIEMVLNGKASRTKVYKVNLLPLNSTKQCA